MNKQINKQITILMSMVFLVITLTSLSSASLGTFPLNSSVDLIQTCNNCTYCNVTAVKYPNGTNIINNVEMNEDGTYYNYIITSPNISEFGLYKYCYDCGNEIEKETGCIDFEITATGQNINEGQGITSVGIIIGMILLAGLFGFFGFKFSESDKLFPIALFFMLVSLIIGVFAMQLSYVASRDILYPLATEGLQFTILLGVMWGLVAVALISLLFFMMKVLKEFKVRKSIQENSDGYDGQNGQNG